MKNKNKIYVILSAFILASLFLVLFLIWPLLKEIEKNSEDLVSAKNNIVNLGSQTKEIENFKKNYQTYKPNLEIMDRLFIDPNNPVDFIKFLEDAALSSHITSQISLPPSSQESPQSLVLQLSSVGSFSDMLVFLKKIESGAYLTEIENLTVQNSATISQGAQAGNLFSSEKDYLSRKVEASFSIKDFTE